MKSWVKLRLGLPELRATLLIAFTRLSGGKALLQLSRALDEEFRGTLRSKDGIRNG